MNQYQSRAIYVTSDGKIAPAPTATTSGAILQYKVPVQQSPALQGPNANYAVVQADQRYPVAQNYVDPNLAQINYANAPLINPYYENNVNYADPRQIEIPYQVYQAPKTHRMSNAAEAKGKEKRRKNSDVGLIKGPKYGVSWCCQCPTDSQCAPECQKFYAFQCWLCTLFLVFLGAVCVTFTGCMIYFAGFYRTK